MKIDYAKLIASIAVCQLAGYIGSMFTSPAIPGWYSGLEKPFFNPPDWIFGVVWTALFVLMGIAMYIVWSKGLGSKEAKIAAALFAAQLALNVLWSAIFFGMKSPFYAFIEIFFLWAAILATTIRFYPISRTSAYLMVPYILWVGFAILLNGAIWILNRA